MRILTLVDTSVWIDHFNRPISLIYKLVEGEAALCHPLIIGEMACGRMPDRQATLGFLRSLERAVVPEHSEVMAMVESLELHGCGLSWVDVNLIASALLSRAYLFTRDKQLLAVASKLGLQAPA